MNVAAEAAAQPRQIFPPLTPAEYADLRESIQRQGVLHPILVDQNGEIVDGHHRKAIADELMVTLPVHPVQVRDEAHACEIVLEANLQHGGNRPRLVQSREDRAPVVLKCRQSGMTESRIAEIVGVSQSVVHDDLQFIGADKVQAPLRLVARDGRSFPSSKATPAESARRDELVAEMTAKGISGVEQARVLGVSQSLVSIIKKRLAEHRAIAGSTRTRAAIAEREERVRDLAAHGHTKDQIAAELGVSRKVVTETCKRYGIEVPADVVRGNVRRIDSNRIVATTVHELEATQIALDMVDLDQLDTAQIEHWTASLSQSIRVLTRFNKRLKEWSSDQQG